MIVLYRYGIFPCTHCTTACLPPVIQTRSTNKDERKLEYYYTLVFVYVACVIGTQWVLELLMNGIDELRGYTNS